MLYNTGGRQGPEVHVVYYRGYVRALRYTLYNTGGRQGSEVHAEHYRGDIRVLRHFVYITGGTSGSKGICCLLKGGGGRASES